MKSQVQHIRLMDPTRKGNVLCQFETNAHDYRVVLSEALAKLHPNWAQLSHMETMLQSFERGEWVVYL